jgi:hypothetical protein
MQPSAAEDKFLFTLNSGSHSIKSFRVGDDGGLVPASSVQRLAEPMVSQHASYFLALIMTGRIDPTRKRDGEMSSMLAHSVRKAFNLGGFLLALVIMSAPAQAQKHEIGLTLGGIFSQDRTATDSTQLSLGSATALQANYAHRLVDAHIVSVSIGTHFLANGSRSINSTNDLLPRSVATLYVTPDVIVKLLPHTKLQPWATVGGGYGQYESSRELLDGSANGGKIRIHRGVLVYGGGVDLLVWRWFALRGEIRDFYSGSPSVNVPFRGGQHNIVAGGGFVLRFGD